MKFVKSKEHANVIHVIHVVNSFCWDQSMKRLNQCYKHHEKKTQLYLNDILSKTVSSGVFLFLRINVLSVVLRNVVLQNKYSVFSLNLCNFLKIEIWTFLFTLELYKPLLKN